MTPSKPTKIPVRIPAYPTTPLELSDQQRLNWLRLVRTKNVGPAAFRTLLNRYASAETALEALPELTAGKPITPYPLDKAEAEIEAAQKIGAELVAIGELGFPYALGHIDPPPPLLYVIGNKQLAARPMIAIVGSRKSSAAGQRMAAELAINLGRAGLVVVSGLARGIDTIAHRAALETGTAACQAGGIDWIYPPENKDLYREISRHGLLVSEMPPGTQPTAQHFPRRNRLIAGMAHGVVIIEAARKSGSLITARLALEQGREVFAVPGSPLDPRAAGPNRLIKQGAILTENADDVLEALAPMLNAPKPALLYLSGTDESGEDDYTLKEMPTADARTRVIELLGVSPVSTDELIRQSGLAAAQLRGILLELELSGRLSSYPGQLISVKPEPAANSNQDR